MSLSRQLGEPPGASPDNSQFGTNMPTHVAWNRPVFDGICELVGADTADGIAGRFRADLSGRFVAMDVPEALRRDAHAIASSAGMLGFDALSQAAVALTVACQGGEDLTPYLLDLKAAKRCALEALAVWCESTSEA